MSVIDFSKQYAGDLLARADEIEDLRRLPTDIADEFRKAGVFRMLVPEQYGGLESHPGEFVEVLKNLSYGDGSAGWNAMIGSTTGVLSASLPTEFAEEIYAANPDVLTVGVTAPIGKAEIVEGGYKVTGRWPFGSGSQNAQWICGGCLVYKNGEKVIGKFGPESLLMMFKADQVTIEDTWHVSGLKGTGSNHFHVDEAFVPEGRCIVLGGKTLVRKPLFQFPLLGLLALGVSSVSLGIGYRALETFKELAGVKKPTQSNRKLLERTSVQSEVARSVADLQSSEAYMHKVINDAWAIAERGDKLDLETKASLRLAAANTTHRSVAAVDRLYQLGGGSSIYLDNLLQRCFRDVHVITQHIMVASPIFEVTGKVILGVDPRQPI